MEENEHGPAHLEKKCVFRVSMRRIQPAVYLFPLKIDTEH